MTAAPAGTDGSTAASDEIGEVGRRPPLTIVAPLTGVMVPLDQVPDPVFARKMVGDGFSIDPRRTLFYGVCRRCREAAE